MRTRMRLVPKYKVRTKKVSGTVYNNQIFRWGKKKGTIISAQGDLKVLRKTSRGPKIENLGPIIKVKEVNHAKRAR
jgi:hypothetical protein